MVYWPEIQSYMDHPRYKECYECNSVDNEDYTISIYAVPEDLYYEVQDERLYPAEFDTVLGHIVITKDEIVLNGVKYTRDGSKLEKGSEVILYSPYKGYWITTCTSNEIIPIFEDSSTLIESELIGIKND